MSRDSIRKALLGSKSEFKKEVVKFNGVKVEIRQPSMKARRDIMKRATNEKGVDVLEFIVWSVIENTYVENTEEKVFESADYDALMEKPTGGFIDKFGEVASKLMNIDEDIEAEAKNS